MSELAVLAALIAAIVAVAWLKARQTIRRERGLPRGLAPGKGDHIIEVEYSSGLGGGQSTQIRVPRDPQDYARRFVPQRAASRAAAGPGSSGASAERKLPGGPVRSREARSARRDGRADDTAGATRLEEKTGSGGAGRDAPREQEKDRT